MPRKSVYLAFILLLAGVILFIIGFFFDKSYVFWIASGLVLIPGIYFSVKFVQAFKSQDKQ